MAINFRVAVIWHEVDCPGGMNIFTFAEKLTDAANETGLNYMVNLNDIDFRVKPGSLPKIESSRLAQMIQDRQDAYRKRQD